MALEVAIGEITLPTAGTEVDFTISGFGTPTYVEFFVGRSTVANTLTDEYSMCIGATDGTREWAAYAAGNHGSTVAADIAARGFTAVACLALIDPVTHTDEGRLSIDTFITDGVRLAIDLLFPTAWKGYMVLYRGDDCQFFTTTVAMPSAGSPVTITPGFKSVLVTCSGVGRASGNDGAHRISRGYCKNDPSLTQRCFEQFIDTAIPAEVEAEVFTNGIVAQTDNDWVVKVSEITSTTVELSLVLGSPGGDECGITAIRCPNAVDVVTYSTPTSTGNDSFTSLPFKPMFLEFATNRMTSLNTELTGNATASFGISSVTASDEMSVTQSFEDNVSTTNSSNMMANATIRQIDHLGADENVATLTSFDNTGFTLNFSSAGSSSYFWPMMAIQDSTTIQTGGSDIMTMRIGAA